MSKTKSVRIENVSVNMPKPGINKQQAKAVLSLAEAAKANAYAIQQIAVALGLPEGNQFGIYVE
jgi:RNA 3'-terminal phosphate cyclase